MGLNVTEKTRVNLARRTAARRGMRLTKSGTRDPKALDFNRYALIKLATNVAVSPDYFEVDGQHFRPFQENAHPCSWTLEQVEDYLKNN